ncbi:hypothetical protein F8M41_019900, partial [Gigaspora margarita]
MPVTPGYNVSFVSRNEMQAVVDNTGKIFIYGGINLTTDYAAVILPNSLIIYIGGRIFNSGTIVLADMNNSKMEISLLLVVQMMLMDTLQYLLLLLLNTNTWMWTIPNLSLTNGPPSLTYHSAALYEDYIIIAFGRITTTSNKTLINNVYILDMKNYAWVTLMNLNKHTASISGSPTTSISGNPTSQTQETSSHLLIGI